MPTATKGHKARKNKYPIRTRLPLPADATVYQVASYASPEQRVRLAIFTERDWTWVQFEDRPAQQVADAVHHTLSGAYSGRRMAWYIQRPLAVEEIAQTIGARLYTPAAPDAPVEADTAGESTQADELPNLWSSDPPEPPETAPTTTPTQTRDRASALRQRADAMSSQIQAKLNPAIGQQRPTARRAKIADGMAAEGRFLLLIQEALYALADAHAQGTIPATLAAISTRAEVETILICQEYPTGSYQQDRRDRLTRLSVGVASYPTMRADLLTLSDAWREAQRAAIGGPTPTAQARVQKITAMERALIGRRIPGFFPTPAPVCAQMVEAADLGALASIPDARVLEPSAGCGSLADAISATLAACAPHARLDTIEVQQELRDILREKGYALIDRDFLGYFPPTEDRGYDRILMNPPFEASQDVFHIYHAYLCLRPGGRLVALASASVEFRQQKDFVTFRSWLAEVGGSLERLPDGAFLQSLRSTGVNAVLIVIDHL